MRSDLYQRITDRIVTDLEQESVLGFSLGTRATWQDG